MEFGDPERHAQSPLVLSLSMKENLLELGNSESWQGFSYIFSLSRIQGVTKRLNRLQGVKQEMIYGTGQRKKVSGHTEPPA